MNFWATTLSAALCFLASTSKAEGPLTENVINWKGLKHYNSDKTEVLHEMNGQTGWTKTGEGVDAQITYQMSMTLLRGDGAPLSDGIGLLWTMPLGISTPANHIWETFLFVNSSETGKKTQGSFRTVGDINMTTGVQYSLSGV